MRCAINVDIPGYGNYWLWLVTYESRAELKAATEKYHGYMMDDISTTEDDGIMGLFSDNLLKTNYLGIMRLYDVGFQTIIHESVHAAVSMANKAHGHSRTLSRVKEEAVAYAAMSIASAVADVLHPLGDYE